MKIKEGWEMLDGEPRRTRGQGSRRRMTLQCKLNYVTKRLKAGLSEAVVKFVSKGTGR